MNTVPHSTAERSALNTIREIAIDLADHGRNPDQGPAYASAYTYWRTAKTTLGYTRASNHLRAEMYKRQGEIDAAGKGL